MAKVLSIELGQSIVRICETDYKTKKSKVYHSFELQTPEGSVNDGYVVKTDELAQLIVDTIKGNNIKTKKVVFSISSTKIANREATLPYVKPNKLDALVQASVGDYFPVVIANSKVAYQIVDTPTLEDGTKKYKLSLLVAPNDLLESYYDLAKQCGLEIAAIDYTANSISVLTKEVLPEGVQLVVKFDGKTTQLFVCDNGVIVLQRLIPSGMDMVVETLIDGMKKLGKEITYQQVMQMLREQPIFETGMETDVEKGKDCGDVPYELCRAAVESLGILPGTIVRVIDFYNSRNKDNVIEDVYITGFAENFRGFSEILSTELGLTIRRFSDRTTNNTWYISKNAGSFVACIGATMAPIDLIPDAHKTNKATVLKISTGTETKSDERYVTYGIITTIACGAVAIIMLLTSLIPYFIEKSENTKLLKKEAELVAIEDVYKDKIRSELVLGEMENMYAMTEFQNDNLSDFLEELEAKLPANVNVLSFSSTEENVTINMNVDSKEAVALVIQEFRSFASLDTITVTSLAEEVDELGLSSIVNFTIDCTYAPVIHEENNSEVIVGAE